MLALARAASLKTLSSSLRLLVPGPELTHLASEGTSFVIGPHPGIASWGGMRLLAFQHLAYGGCRDLFCYRALLLHCSLSI